jgi:hypothetical protein
VLEGFVLQKLLVNKKYGVFSIVVIRVFDGARVTEKAVRPAIQQPDVTEVMIINDGSTDETQSMLEQLEQDYSKIKIPTGLTSVGCICRLGLP